MKLKGRTLMVRRSGDDVKELQGELSKLGYDIPEDEANRAFYGQSTHDSVRKFQSEASLTVTGIVNQSTKNTCVPRTST